MKTSAEKRLVRLSGLLLLSLLVVALAVQAAQAAQVAGTGTGSGTSWQLPTLAQVQQHHGDIAAAGSGTISTLQLPTSAQVQQHHGDVAAAGTASVTTARAGTQGRGGVNSAPITTARAGTQGRGGVNLAPLAPVSGAQPASSGISSTTIWIAAVAVVGALLIGFWALALPDRRRPRTAEACPGETTTLMQRPSAMLLRVALAVPMAYAGVGPRAPLDALGRSAGSVPGHSALVSHLGRPGDGTHPRLYASSSPT